MARRKKAALAVPRPSLDNPDAPNRPATLTEREARFAQAYAETFNAARSYRLAVHPDVIQQNTANTNGWRMLQRQDVLDRIEAIKRTEALRMHTSRRKVLGEMAAMAHSTVDDILDFSGDAPCFKRAEDIPLAARRAIKKVKVKKMTYPMDRFKDHELIEIEMHGKDRQLTNLAQHFKVLDGAQAEGKAVFVLVVPEQALTSGDWMQKYALAAGEVG